MSNNTTGQPEPDEIARRYRLERIERAVRFFLESDKTPEDFHRSYGELKIAYYLPPAPPPDEPRLTRMELIALADAAESHAINIQTIYGVEVNRREREEAIAAVACARDIIARGESRLSPERFTIAPDEPALTPEELYTLAEIAEDYAAIEPSRAVEWMRARVLAKRVRRVAGDADARK